MATATKPRKPAAKPGKPARKREPKTTMAYLQDALSDLDKARAHAQQDARSGIESAIERIRDAAAQLRERTAEPAREFESRLEHMSEDARRELARMAIEAQESPESLKELGAVVRRRKQELSAG
jgi:hypothetical protein